MAEPVMLPNGRWTDVLVQPLVNPELPLAHKTVGFYVWADEDMGPVLLGVAGVWSWSQAGKGLYIAMLDMRFDPDAVKDAIETAVLVESLKRQSLGVPAPRGAGTCDAGLTPARGGDGNV